jgi:hypothetical protein
MRILEEVVERYLRDLRMLDPVVRGSRTTALRERDCPA